MRYTISDNQVVPVNIPITEFKILTLLMHGRITLTNEVLFLNTEEDYLINHVLNTFIITNDSNLLMWIVIRLTKKACIYQAVTPVSYNYIPIENQILKKYKYILKNKINKQMCL